MTYRIDEIDGIGPVFRDKLRGAGIRDSDALLARCGSAAGRRQVSDQTGIHERMLLRWANMADLMRIEGVGLQLAALLEAAGIDTIRELRRRNAHDLVAAIRAVTTLESMVGRAPSQEVLDEWVEAARSFDSKVSY